MVFAYPDAFDGDREAVAELKEQYLCSDSEDGRLLTRPARGLIAPPVGRGVCGQDWDSRSASEDPFVPGPHVTDQHVRMNMEFRRQHTQLIADQEPLPVPQVCPVTLDELLAE